MRAMAEQHGLDYVNLSEVSIPPSVVELVPESVARENVAIPLSEADGKLTVIVSDPMDYDTFDKLRFILNRQIEIALAPREAILEAINRHYGQTVGESADSMLQEFTDTAIDFTETDAGGGGRRGGGRREQRPGGAAGAIDDYRGGATAGLGHPHRAVRGPDSGPLPDRRHVGGAGQPPQDGCSGPSSPASRFSPSSTLPSAGGPRTAGSRSASARRSSTFGSA